MSSAEEEEPAVVEEEENSSEAVAPPLPEEDLPARADRDRFAPLGHQVGNPDKACLSCMVVIAITVLVFIACLVFYYLKNPAFHQS